MPPKPPPLTKKDILYPELSYQIIGILFDVFNKLGPGFQEKYYQKEIAAKLKILGIPYKEQAIYRLKLFDATEIKYSLDFVIDGKML